MRSTAPMAVTSSPPGGMVYQAILLVCASVALGFIANALLGAIGLVPGAVAWTSMGQALVSTLLLSISVFATVNGCRAGAWDLSVADVLFGVVKGMALILLAAMSHPGAPAGWSFIAAIYAASVVLHLGRVRAVISGASPDYRRHLKSAQRGTLTLTLLMSGCFVTGCLVQPVIGAQVAPAIAGALAVVALRSEAIAGHRP